ncbi:MAG: ankyrin repeat domain-containing protein [Dechloromonas sp.]|uniref:Ankyrin repeat domain-containing protein n=1 Tax=Candidatus Dechloromonas phosphorivorans TaxID=2899244 RepID=A0A935JU84_9RHOO|nr:ankyrin repeat domain-containing protein [Candidatus Dechloromonas phosphorivorans]
MTIEIEDNLSIFYTELIESRISILSEGGFNNKRTPLHHACGQGKYLIVDWLINHGAKVDALDGESNTPLFYSSSQEFNSISELLIANGADPLLSRQGVENSLKIQLHEKEQELEALKNNYDKNIEDAKPIEITAIIERLELLEDKLGVRFEGVYCSQIKRSWEIPVDYVIEANFDVIGTGEILNRSFSPTLSAYNVSGQLLNTSTSFINNDRFLGIESIKIQMVCAEAPTRLRLYPANPI